MSLQNQTSVNPHLSAGAFSQLHSLSAGPVCPAGLPVALQGRTGDPAAETERWWARPVEDTLRREEGGDLNSGFSPQVLTKKEKQVLPSEGENLSVFWRSSASSLCFSCCCKVLTRLQKTQHKTINTFLTMQLVRVCVCAFYLCSCVF